MEELKLFLIESHQLRCDRRFKSSFRRSFFILIFSILAFLTYPKYTNSQKINELAFEDMVANFVASHPKNIDSISGFTTKGLLQRIHLFPKAEFDLNLDPPVVDFELLKKGQYLRKISTVITYLDSTSHEYALTYTDTISASAISKVRKSNYDELCGPNPKWAAKYLLPIGMIGTGIAGIISLFYFRSS